MEPQIGTHIAVQLDRVERVVTKVVVSQDKIDFFRQNV